jgi:hypothetical protein
MAFADIDPLVPYQHRRSFATFCSQPAKNLDGKFLMWMQRLETFYSPKMAMTMHFRV